MYSTRSCALTESVQDISAFLCGFCNPKPFHLFLGSLTCTPYACCLDWCFFHGSEVQFPSGDIILTCS